MKAIVWIILSSAFGLLAADDREAALLRAMSSVQNAAERVGKDSARPQYHFRAPANWINDPNGPIFHGGYYHMFYQHNPYGDAWGHMHWGHARSKDLVSWEHLPIALWPSEGKGEKHCFSGCAALNAKGEPMIFYTSIGHAKPECWIAIPEDKDLIRWKKFEGNPILTEASPDVPYFDFRDPFVFAHQGRTFMVHGGNLNKAKGGQAVVSLYEAENPELTKWKYKSILFQHPDPKVVNIECPLFFSMGEKFVLITSPHRACDYFIGNFDPTAGKFVSEQSGMVDYSGQFYAPNCLVDGQGRRIMWGWVRGFKEKRRWNGCLSVPRILSVEGGKLIQKPAPELASLRAEDAMQTASRLRPDTQSFSIKGTRMFEMLVNLELESARKVEIRLRQSADESRSIKIDFDGTTLDVAGTRVSVEGDGKTLALQIFVDHALMEVFVNGGRHCVTRVVDIGQPEDRDIHMVVDSGSAAVPFLKVWQLKSIW